MIAVSRAGHAVALARFASVFDAELFGVFHV